ncbi:MAG: hypothetical protein GY794_24160, partial [bacterium]|nr:hypothetical protein [bacterium]
EQQRELEIQHKLAEAAEARQQAEEKSRREAEQRAAEQKRAATRLQGLSRGLSLVLVLALSITVWAFHERDRARLAQKDAERASSRQLAVQAQMALEQSPQRSLLLGVEALKVTLDDGGAGEPFAKEILQNALQKVGAYGLELDGAPWEVAFSSDNYWLAAGSASGTVCLWNLQDDDPALAPICLRGHEGAIYRTAISEDERWLVTGGSDKKVRLWNLSEIAEKKTQKAEYILEGHHDTIEGMRLSGDGRWLATGDEDMTILWDLFLENPAERPITLQGNISRWLNEHDISPDDRWLVTHKKNGTIWLWDLTSENPFTASRQLTGHSEEVYTVAFSADSRWFASGSRNETDAYLWDLSDVQDIAPYLFSGHAGGVRMIAVSDTGWLVTVSQDGIARLWNVAEENKPRIFPGHKADVSRISMSPDNHWLVTGDEDGTVQLWDLQAANPFSTAQQLSGHKGPVYGLEISADSRRLMTRSWDGVVLRWDLQTADPPASSIAFPGQKEFGWRAALSKDSRWFAMSSQNHFARLWDLEAEIPSDIPDEPGQSIELACRSVKRNLSHKEWEQYFPGEDYRETCPGLPIPESIVD